MKPKTTIERDPRTLQVHVKIVERTRDRWDRPATFVGPFFSEADARRWIADHQKGK